MLEEIYLKATHTARALEQTTGTKRNYYVTLEQLEAILKEFED